MKVALSLICVVLIVCAAADISAGQKSSAASIRGHVLDTFGNPITEVALELSNTNTAQPFRTLTDQRGAFELTALPAGEYDIVIQARGFITERHTIGLGKGSALQLDFGLVAGHLGDSIPIEVSGVVRKQDKSPLANAVVAVENVFSRRLVYKARTDKSGRYKIGVPYPGQYIISASMSGFTVNASAVVLPATLPRQNKVINLTLPLCVCRDMMALIQMYSEWLSQCGI